MLKVSRFDCNSFEDAYDLDLVEHMASLFQPAAC